MSMSNYNPNYVPQKNYFLVGQKCVVFNKEGKILLLKRSDKSGGGGWSLIGGGLDKGEDPIESIKREAREEAQVEISDIKPIKLISFDEDGDSVLLIFYQAKTDSEKITLNWEHDEYRWMSVDEALRENLSEVINENLKLARF